jgi:hypothetical protein
MRARPKISPEEFIVLALEWRGIDYRDACGMCGGSGTQIYGDTSTWRRDIGGQSLTNDVCDECWGSGDRARPWPDRRALVAPPQPQQEASSDE